VSGPPPLPSAEPPSGVDPVVDAALPGLRGRSARGGALLLGAQAVLFIAALASTAVLARVLTVRDFGLFFMVAVLVSFVSSFRDFGFPMATVHAPHIEQRAVSALFWLNARLNAALLVAMVALAPLLAWFFRERQLVAMTVVLAASLTANGLTKIHLGLLRRELRFAAVTAITVTAALAGVAVAIVAALAGAGFWALVLQQVVQHVGETVGLWTACRWRPSGPARAPHGDEAYTALRRYGGDVTVARVLTHVAQNLDAVLVGRFVGTVALGLYQNAYRWATVLLEQLYTPLQAVVVATLSRVRDDTERYRSHFRAVVRAVMAVVVPALVLLFLEARAFVLVLLGPQWVEAIPLFRILLVGALAANVPFVLKWVYYSEGQTRRQRSWAFIATPVTVVAVAAGVAGGATGVAAGFAASQVALTYPAVRYCLARSGLRERDFWSVVWRPAVTSLLAAGAVVAAQRAGLVWDRQLYHLIAATLFFGAAYAGSWVMTPGGRTELAAMWRVVTALRDSGEELGDAPAQR